MKKFLLEIFICLFCFLIDLISKILIVSNFSLYESKIIIKNVFNFTFVKNTGIIFGLFQGKNIFIVIFLFFVIFLYLFFLKNEFKKLYFLYNKNLYFKIAIGLLLGGAIGNIFDRIYRGYVVDFLDFIIWPVFNLADSFIFISLVIFSFILFFDKKYK